MTLYRPPRCFRAKLFIIINVNANIKAMFDEFILLAGWRKYASWKYVYKLEI